MNIEKTDAVIDELSARVIKACKEQSGIEVERLTKALVMIMEERRYYTDDN